jgi:hypothetical protein
VDGFDILMEAPREAFEAAVLGGADPAVELVGQSRLIVVEKIFGKSS